MSEFLEITTPIGSDDYKLFVGIVNQGIDSHLEAFTRSEFTVVGERFRFNFHKSELPILLRRLDEIDTEDAAMWVLDLEASDS